MTSAHLEQGLVSGQTRSTGATVRVWLKAARAPFLTMSVIHCLLGGLIALCQGPIDPARFLIATLGVAMAHAAANLIDDYFDFATGNLANKTRQFHDSPLIAGQVTPRQVGIAAVICIVLAVAAGLYALVRGETPVLGLMLAGGFGVLFYTAPPLRLNYRGFGEFLLFLLVGPALIAGMSHVLTGRITAGAMVASIPVGLFATNVVLVSNLFDHDDDRRAGKGTIPVRFGRAFAVRLLATSSALAYGAIIGGVAFGLLPVGCLLALLTAPLAVGVIGAARDYLDPARYTPAMVRAIRLAVAVGLILCGAYGWTALHGSF